jgi:hypothetical protein
MNHNSSFYNATCRYDDWVVFDGFWIFHIDLDDINNAITKHFVIDHASPDLQQQSEFCINTILLQMRSLAFNGDVMTFKHNVILSHDVQTQVEAAPPLILTPSDPADCNS